MSIRSIGCFGFEQLDLVNPRNIWPNDKGIKAAKHFEKIAQKVIRHAVLTAHMWVNGKRLVCVKTPSKNINEPSIILMRLGLRRDRVVLPVNGRTLYVSQITTRIVAIGVTWCNRGL